MGLSSNAVNLIILASLIAGFIVLCNIWLKFKSIKVIRNNKNLTKEEMQVKVEQLKIVQKVASLTETKVEKLVRLSGNPMKLSPAIFAAVSYILPVILLFVAFLFYIANQASMTYFMVMVAVICFWYPTYHYKEQVRMREQAWFKIQQHIFKIEEELASNGYKKSLLNVAIYLKSVGETELAAGLEHMVELWPKSDEETQKAITEFEYQYPFDIPRDLFVLLINAEDSGISAASRLEAFKRTVVMKYQKFADEVLSKIPATATCLSLPFLMISVVVAMLVPAIVQLMEMF